MSQSGVLAHAMTATLLVKSSVPQMNTHLPSSFAKLVWANLAAQCAEQLSLAATPIVAVLMLGAGPGQIGLLAAVQTLPFLLLSIPLGVAADRSSRRRLMIRAETLRALSLLGLLAVVVTHHLSIELLALLGFIGAVGTVAFSVSAPALVPSIVNRDMLAQANGRLELARSAAFAAGPALGGALVSLAGASSAFVLATILSVTSVAMLWRIVEPQRSIVHARHPMNELRDGAKLVWHEPLLRPILLTAAAWNISWFVLQAAYVPYAVRVLGLNASAVGTTLAAYGVGMIVGALATPRFMAHMRFGKAVLIGPAISVLAAAAMVLTLRLPSGLLAGASFFLFGAGPIIWTITSTTLRQTVTPGAMLGRVSAIFLTVNFGARPVGAVLGALIGMLWGEPACLLVALGGFMLQAAVIFGSRVRVLHSLPAPAAS
jgi:predicted MFS family arabinose efflux permease